MNNKETREVIRYKSSFAGDASLICADNHVTEVSFPTAAVPNAVRIETEAYVLKVRLTKNGLAIWKPVLDEIKARLIVIPQGETMELARFALVKNKKGVLSVVDTDGAHALRHVSPGWFRSEEELATYDFFEEF